MRGGGRSGLGGLGGVEDLEGEKDGSESWIVCLGWDKRAMGDGYQRALDLHRRYAELNIRFSEGKCPTRHLSQ